MMEAIPTNTELSSLTALGDDLFCAEEKVLELEVKLKQAIAKRDRIANFDIPEMMKEIGVLEFRTPSCKIELNDVLTVKPKADNRPLVMKSVEEDGAGHLIKTTVTVPFNRGEDEKVKELVDHLQEAGMQSKQDKKIEPSTLKKYVKDKLENGKAVDMELFGVKQFSRAKFSDGAPKAPIFEDE